MNAVAKGSGSRIAAIEVEMVVVTESEAHLKIFDKVYKGKMRKVKRS